MIIHINFQNCFLIPIYLVQACFWWKSHRYEAKKFRHFYNNFFIFFSRKAELLQK